MLTPPACRGRLSGRPTSGQHHDGEPALPSKTPTLLFVEFWQHECCGELFEVGETVVWPVAPVEDDELVSLLGVELGQRLRLAVDRHQDELLTWSGTVRSIQAVFHQQELVTGHADGTYYRALPGSAQLRSIARTQRREWLDDLEWASYVVELSDDAEPPTGAVDADSPINRQPVAVADAGGDEPATVE